MLTKLNFLIFEIFVKFSIIHSVPGLSHTQDIFVLNSGLFRPVVFFTIKNSGVFLGFKQSKTDIFLNFEWDIFDLLLIFSCFLPKFIEELQFNNLKKETFWKNLKSSEWLRTFIFDLKSDNFVVDISV